MRQTTATVMRALERDPSLGVELLGDGARELDGAFIDTRNPRPGGLFVCLVAARDGHEFAAAAIEAGAAGVLVERGRLSDEVRDAAIAQGMAVFVVRDTRAGLWAMAQAVRAEISGPVVAITGSNGKTTTRALTSAAFEVALPGRVLSTVGNLNNDLGVPLTLLCGPDRPDAAVLELGMSAPGENARLAGLVRPDIAIVTSVALEHLEFMGSIEAIAAAEMEVAEHLAPGGTLILPFDEPLLHARLDALMRGGGLAQGVTTRTFGPTVSADLQICEIARWPRPSATLRFRDGDAQRIELSLFGAHNLRNAAAALLAADAAGIARDTAARALATVIPPGDRSRPIAWRGHTLIADCYNANPGSMQAAIVALSDARGSVSGPVIAVLGDMLELGPTELALHEQVGRACADAGLDEIVCVGVRARAIAHAARAQGVTTVIEVGEDLGEAARWLVARLGEAPAGVVLFKASRGVRLERVIEALTAA